MIGTVKPATRPTWGTVHCALQVVDVDGEDEAPDDGRSEYLAAISHDFINFSVEEQLYTGN